jgi:BirA family biotin operon repressor/biotin-[acetyl-CoA-carboxylase] ligase
MLGRRKVAGILTEGTFDQTGNGFVIVGAGVNVNTGMGEFPDSIKELATSLRLGIGRAISRVTLLQGFLHELEGWYERLCRREFEGILRSWRRYETILGELVEVCLPGSKLWGVAEDLDSDGGLLVRDKMGRQHRILAGDVRLCRVQEGKPFEA